MNIADTYPDIPTEKFIDPESLTDVEIPLIEFEKRKGELIDIVAYALNTLFGKEHIENMLKHGINFTLDKIIRELEMLVDDETSDKKAKRLERLEFLRFCKTNPYIMYFFSIFCNYLNGGGNEDSEGFTGVGQYNSNMVLTVAGGNIVTIFAQLIVNMIDSYHKVNIINSRVVSHSEFLSHWNVYDPNYKLPDFTAQQLMPNMVSLIFDNLDLADKKKFNDIIASTFKLLTKTNRSLLTCLATFLEQTQVETGLIAYSREQLCFIIVKHFMTASNATEARTLAYTIAMKHPSDFDYKLSPNIHRLLLELDKYLRQVNISEIVARQYLAQFNMRAIMGRGRLQLLDTQIDAVINFLKKHFNSLSALLSSDDIGAQFLLFRIKTFIDFRYKSSDEIDALEVLKKEERERMLEFKKDCDKYTKIPEILYPQTMQKELLKEVPLIGDCYTYLQYLLDKKEANNDSTMRSIYGVMKHYDPNSQNPTEAILLHMHIYSRGANIFIVDWENGIIPNKWDAPALYDMGKLKPIKKYEDVFKCFLHINNIMKKDNSLVLRLASDIIHTFLSKSKYQIEQILESIVGEHAKEPHPENTEYALIPIKIDTTSTDHKYIQELQKIERIFEKKIYSDYPYPDGARILIITHIDEQKVPSPVAPAGFALPLAPPVAPPGFAPPGFAPSVFAPSVFASPVAVGFAPAVFAPAADVVMKGGLNNKIMRKVRVKKARTMRRNQHKSKKVNKSRKANKSKKSNKSRKSRKSRKVRKYKV